jgi:hypothetical protein
MKADLSCVKGKHNAKFGVQISHTFLTEGFNFGITDPNFNDPASPDFLPGLLPFDLTRGGSPFLFHGHTDIKQEALFAQDNVTLGNATVMLGLRFDNYNGITKGHSLQPRVGISYLVKRTNTILRGSYTRNFETPYNENLILSSATGAGGLANGILGDTSNQPLLPGRRNQFNAGLQQAVGEHFVIDVDYFNKRTTNGYDFNVLFNTSVVFPISWQRSKIDGVSSRINFTNYKGLSAFSVLGHTRRVISLLRVAAYSSTQIYPLVSSGSIMTRRFSKPPKRNINSNTGSGCHPTLPSPGGTTVVWCREPFRTSIRH